MLERFLGVSDREARLIIEAELGRKLPGDFEAQVKQATLKFYEGDLRAILHIARRDRRDRSAQMRRLERHAGKDQARPDLRRPL